MVSQWCVCRSTLQQSSSVLYGRQQTRAYCPVTCPVHLNLYTMVCMRQQSRHCCVPTPSQTPSTCCHGTAFQGLVGGSWAPTLLPLFAAAAVVAALAPIAVLLLIVRLQLILIQPLWVLLLLLLSCSCSRFSARTVQQTQRIRACYSMLQRCGTCSDLTDLPALRLARYFFWEATAPAQGTGCRQQSLGPTLVQCTIIQRGPCAHLASGCRTCCAVCSPDPPA